MERFSLFLESAEIDINQMIPFISAILVNPEDEQTMLVFADWLDEHGDRGLAYAAEGIRKMLSENPYSDDKKDHNELLKYYNGLVKPIFNAFEKLDIGDEPGIQPEHGLIYIGDKKTIKK